MIYSDDKSVREKLIARGAESLSDAELLSILLGEGANGLSALELAQKVFEQQNKDGAGSFSSLAHMDLPRLRMAGGMGVKKAAVVAAALEVGKRIGKQEALSREVINGDADVAQIFQPLLAGLSHEEFWVVCLSSSNRIVDKVRVSQGGVSGTVVDHKLIIKRAVELLCPAIIVVHNHPSGTARPSAEDIALTQRLESATTLFDITLLDHLIITAGECFSFRKEGLIGRRTK